MENGIKESGFKDNMGYHVIQKGRLAMKTNYGTKKTGRATMCKSGPFVKSTYVRK